VKHADDPTRDFQRLAAGLLMASVDTDTRDTVTRLLHAARDGDPSAFDRLMPLVYTELKQVADRQLRREYVNQAPRATALVHELYLKLVNQAQIDWHGRAHFFTIAARAMRQVLVDHARKRKTKKRGGDWQRTTLVENLLSDDAEWDDLLALDDALDRLDAVDERMRKVVEYRFFGGMTEQEVAGVLGVSVRTVQRDWAKARAWLYDKLYSSDG
jgi:RNA polymerase sigma factor (TIGR02999 family)